MHAPTSNKCQSENSEAVSEGQIPTQAIGVLERRKLQSSIKIALAAFAVSTIAIIMLFYFGKPILDTSQGTLLIAQDLIAIAIAVTSLVVGTYYARKALTFQQDVVGKKPEIRLWIGRSALIPEDLLGIKEVAFGYSVKEGAKVFCVIPFVVDNNGEADAIDVHLRVTMPANVSAHGLTKIDAEKMLGDLETSGVRRKSYEYNNRWVLDYTIPRIPPGTGVELNELVDATYSSGVEYNMKAVTRDKVPVAFKVNLALLSEVSVSIWASDTKPLSNSFIIRSYQTTDHNEIGKRIMQERQESLGEELRKADAGEATAGVRPVDLLRRALVVIPELQRVLAPEHSETKEHYTAVYVERRPEQSERWIITPLTKGGIIDVDLKNLKDLTRPLIDR